MAKKKITVITVTYDNRFYLLKQVIDACLRERVDRIIIVDNNSSLSVREQLKKIKRELKDKIKVLSLDDNIGSAGGYKLGLQEAYNDPDCDFIWLLDDDNKPREGALSNLMSFWNSLEEENKEEKVALLSFRPSREIYKTAVLKNNYQLLLGRKNSFLGFHFIDFPSKVLRKVGLIIMRNGKNLKARVGVVPVAPYGGLFFHKKLLDVIGFPREDFFLYADDHEWTYRITRHGGKIIIVFDSIIDDLDASWHMKESLSFYTFLHAESQMRVYYSVRNRIIFEKENLVSIPILYVSNIVIYKYLLKFFYLFSGNKKKAATNIKIFNKAVKDGLQGLTGKVDLE